MILRRRAESTRRALSLAFGQAGMARLQAAAAAGLGGVFAIGSLSALSGMLGVPLLLAPFGASCVLVFGIPASPFARARNIVGGYLLSGAVGLGALTLPGPETMGMAVGVGLAIMAMMMTDTIHPPAGAVPIVVALSHPDLFFLLAPVGAGAALIVLIGALYRRLPVPAVSHRARRGAAPDRPRAPQ
jgi:CBS-domain-containing membrane protein